MLWVSYGSIFMILGIAGEVTAHFMDQWTYGQTSRHSTGNLMFNLGLTGSWWLLPLIISFGFNVFLDQLYFFLRCYFLSHFAIIRKTFLGRVLDLETGAFACLATAFNPNYSFGKCGAWLIVIAMLASYSFRKKLRRGSTCLQLKYVTADLK